MCIVGQKHFGVVDRGSQLEGEQRTGIGLNEGVLGVLGVRGLVTSQLGWRMTEAHSRRECRLRDFSRIARLPI